MEQTENLYPEKQIILIREVLTSLHNNQEMYPQKMATEFKQKVAAMLWPAIPKHVSALNLGGNVQIERATDKIKFVPIDKRETWDLQKVEQYGAQISKVIGQKWEPIFT